MAVREEIMLAVDHLIQDNRQITYERIQYIKQMGLGNVTEILYPYLPVKTIVSWWVPDTLTDAQKQAQVQWGSDKQILKQIRPTSPSSPVRRHVYDIITGV